MKFGIALLLAVLVLMPVAPHQAQASHAVYGGYRPFYGGPYYGRFGFRPVCAYRLYPGCRAPFRKFYRGAARFALYGGRGFVRVGVRVGGVSVRVAVFGRRRFI